MALSLPLGTGLGSEPLSHPPGAPREPDFVGRTVCPASGEESTSPEQAQTLGQDALGPPEHFQGGPRGNEPAARPPRWSTPSSHEDPAGGRHCEHPASGLEVLEAEQDSLHLSLLGLGLWLQDLEQGPGRWALAQSGMVQLRALQADLRGAAERVEALITFGEGLAQRSEPRAWEALEQILRALGAHRDTIFRRLWQLQAQLVSYSLVFEEADTLNQDLEIEGDSDWPGPGGVWGPWAPSSLPTSAELEWDPAGDIGGLGPSGQKTARILGAPCELCGHRGPQGRVQGLEEPHTSHSRQDMLESSLSHWKHLAGHRRRSLLRKPQDKKRQASPQLQDVRLEGNPGAPDPASRWPLTFLLILFLLFLLLVGAVFLLPVSGGLCCFHARMPRIPYLVLSYVNGLPPV
ncbi:nesprin-4 isoform X3 [Cebus imitator]|uniref:Spectrin repeat containing nuclear envelope family member 4 n=1 Tax=Cebus imitator TaxID=2715852 RepID=A0A2K5SI04_CEBIM|nr:nesprin-4 isoform X3 [Cebus imitator]